MFCNDCYCIILLFMTSQTYHWLFALSVSSSSKLKTHFRKLNLLLYPLFTKFGLFRNTSTLKVNLSEEPHLDSLSSESRLIVIITRATSFWSHLRWPKRSFPPRARPQFHPPITSLSVSSGHKLLLRFLEKLETLHFRLRRRLWYRSFQSQENGCTATQQ